MNTLTKQLKTLVAVFLLSLMLMGAAYGATASLVDTQQNSAEVACAPEKCRNFGDLSDTIDSGGPGWCQIAPDAHNCIESYELDD